MPELDNDQNNNENNEDANKGEGSEGEENKGDQEEKPFQTGDSLDAVHDKVVSDLEHEAEEEGDDGDGNDEDEDKDKDKDKPEGSGADDDKDPPEGGDKDPDKEEDPEDEEEPEEEEEQPKGGEDKNPRDVEEPKVDDDVSRPGKYKAEFVDIDGNKHYVSDMDQLPDDFEPKNMKEYGKAIQKLNNEQGQFAYDKEVFRRQEAFKKSQEQTNTLTSAWDKEEEKMTKAGTLPADEKERKKVVEGIYDVMEDELKKGNVINSLAVAYELYQGRQGTQQKADEDKKKKDELNKKKKERGSRIQGGTPSTSGSGGPKVIKGPPAGVTLDQVHEQVTSGLK